MASLVYNRMNPYSFDNLYKKYVKPYVQSYYNKVVGYDQMKNTQASYGTQIDYENYLKAGNERALRDWHKNVPNRQIRYPEFSYAGAIRRSDSSIASLNFSSDNAYSNFVGGVLGKSMGLYSVPGRLYRTL